MEIGISPNTQWNPMKFHHIYHPQFDLSSIPPEQRDVIKQHYMRDTFPVAVSVILHLITFGLFGLIYLGIKHGQLPRLREDDFGAGKAIGFMFIPFYSLYWVFMFWVRFTGRINLQYRLRDQPPPIPRGLVITTVILGLIPYVNFITLPVMSSICVGMMQSACNRLATEIVG